MKRLIQSILLSWSDEPVESSKQYVLFFGNADLLFRTNPEQNLFHAQAPVFTGTRAAASAHFLMQQPVNIGAFSHSDSKGRTFEPCQARHQKALRMGFFLCPSFTVCFFHKGSRTLFQNKIKEKSRCTL